VFEKNLYSRPFVDVFQDDAINKNWDIIIICQNKLLINFKNGHMVL
jgi:hypothetical protein